jgi:ATP-binding cassette, subfamily B, bacterial
MLNTNEQVLERRYRGEHPLRTLIYLYRHQRHNLVFALIFYCMKHSGVWLLPLVTATIIDIVSNPETHQVSELWFHGALLAFIYMQNVPTHYIYTHFISTANRTMEKGLRSALARRLQHLSMNFYQRSSTGAIQAKLLRDVEVIEVLTRQLFEVVPITLITMFIAIIVTAHRAPVFLLFFLLLIPVTLFLRQKMQAPIERRNRDFRRELEGMSSHLSEMVRLIPVTRAHGIEQDELRRVDEHLSRVQNAGMRVDKINALFGATAWVLMQVANTLCLVTAAYLAFNRVAGITAGDVILVTGYFNNLTASISGLIALFPQIAKGYESLYSLTEVLESPDIEHNEGKAHVGRVRGAFKFEGVGFAYPKTEESSLTNIDLEVQPGETVAFIGASGAGKSTLLNLIIGFIRPTQGHILLDGEDMNDLDLRTYRHYLSVVPQQTVLFEGTVKDNILYGVEQYDKAKLQQALKDANVEEFIDDLPEGLDTLIGENGAKLSGGQRQRIAIARALIRDPRVLILDEATSALDTHSERLIQEALVKLMNGRTTFVVAHRLSTIRNANRIVVLEHGRIVEVGNHHDLLEKNGAYARYYHAQEAVQ